MDKKNQGNPVFDIHLENASELLKLVRSKFDVG